MSAERVTTGRWQRRKNTKPPARSTCGASFHCRETVRFSRVRVVLSTLLSHHWQFEQRRSVDDGRGADSNLVLERGHHSWEHNGLRRRMEGPRTHTHIYIRGAYLSASIGTVTVIERGGLLRHTATPWDRSCGDNWLCRVVERTPCDACPRKNGNPRWRTPRLNFPFTSLLNPLLTISPRRVRTSYGLSISQFSGIRMSSSPDW